MKTLLIILLLIPATLYAPPLPDNHMKAQDNFIQALLTCEFSESNLKELLTWVVAEPEIVMAQCRLETGNFTSNIFLDNNNVIGMKLPVIRSTTSTGENRGHAVYSSWQMSVYDICLWQEYYKRFYDISDYSVFLNKFNFHISYINRVEFCI